MEILFIILMLGLILSSYVFVRNNFVYRYRINLTDRCYKVVSHHLNDIPTDVSEEEFRKKKDEHEEYRNMWETIIGCNSYDKMLLSFKPLKDKYWLTKEQIEWLHQYDEGFEDIYKSR